MKIQSLWNKLSEHVLAFALAIYFNVITNNCCLCEIALYMRLFVINLSHEPMLVKLIEAEWRIYASLNWVIIGSDSGLSPVRRQAIIWLNVGIYIMISKNIRYFLWNRGARLFFLDTYLTIKVQGIRCTNHLHDSCPLTDVNTHFTAPGCRYYFKINSWWPIVTSSTHGPAASYCDVTMIHCSHGYLWTHDVEVDAS